MNLFEESDRQSDNDENEEEGIDDSGYDEDDVLALSVLIETLILKIMIKLCQPELIVVLVILGRRDCPLR